MSVTPEQNDRPRCELCGEPMPQGEEMFKFHGYSGPCPKPPLPRPPTLAEAAQRLLDLIDELPEEPGGQQDRVFAAFEFDDLRAALATLHPPSPASEGAGDHEAIAKAVCAELFAPGSRLSTYDAVLAALNRLAPQPKAPSPTERTRPPMTLNVQGFERDGECSECQKAGKVIDVVGVNGLAFDKPQPTCKECRDAFLRKYNVEQPAPSPTPGEVYHKILELLPEVRRGTIRGYLDDLLRAALSRGGGQEWNFDMDAAPKIRRLLLYERTGRTYGGVAAGLHDFSTSGWQWDDGRKCEATAWMELPPPPTAEPREGLASPPASSQIATHWVMRQSDILPGGVVQSIYQDAAGKLHVVRSGGTAPIATPVEALERWHAELHPQTSEHACDEKNCTFRRCFDQILRAIETAAQPEETGNAK